MRYFVSMKVHALLLATGLVAAAASPALALDQHHHHKKVTHHHTHHRMAMRHHHMRAHHTMMRDAFMQVQYNSKAEFVAGLRHHPAALHAMARAVHTTPDELLAYIQ